LRVGLYYQNIALIKSNDMTKAQIVQRLLGESKITAEEAVVLLQESSGIQYIPYQPNPYWTSNPDWTYDPNRPGQPWYTTTSNDPIKNSK
jgi:hypothetical protein